MIRIAIFVFLCGRLAGASVPELNTFQLSSELKDPYSKLVDNNGEGYEPLYGVRNFRMVLKGVLYRGGANNYFHRASKRPNRNPLQASALLNLCREGFASAFYMYQRNFGSAKTMVSCRGNGGEFNTIKYRHYSPFNSRGLSVILGRIHAAITDRDSGPVFVHCWNGWHAAGFVSAVSLRQFCGWNGDQAVAYWDKATDGHNTLDAYKKIRQKIREFRAIGDFQVPESIKQGICPKMEIVTL